jgi:tetratricopeptide (TPR) repeat protein
VIRARSAILEFDPEDPLARVNLADALRRRASRLSGAAQEEELLRALELTALPSAGEEKGGEGEPEGYPEEDDSASGTVEAVLSPRGLNVRGMILLDLGRFDEAIRDFEEAAEEERYVRPRNNLGVLYMRLAFGALQARMDERDPARARALEEEMQSHRRRSLEWIGQVIAIQPKNAKALYNRGELQVRIPPVDIEAARADLEAAIASDPEYDKAKRLLQAVREQMRRTAPSRTAPGGDVPPGGR